MAITDVECCDEHHVHIQVTNKAKREMPDEDELYDLYYNRISKEISNA